MEQRVGQARVLAGSGDAATLAALRTAIRDVYPDLAVCHATLGEDLTGDDTDLRLEMDVTPDGIETDVVADPDRPYPAGMIECVRGVLDSLQTRVPERLRVAYVLSFRPE